MDENHQSFYELVRATEDRIIQISAGKEASKQEVDALIDAYHQSPKRNQVEDIKRFQKFIVHNAKQPLLLRAVPFYETTWMLCGMGEPETGISQVAASMLKAVNKLTGGDLIKNHDGLFKNLIEEQDNLNKRTLSTWLTAAQKGEVIEIKRFDIYRKLVRTMSHAAKTYKAPHTFWANISTNVPEICRHMLITNDKSGAAYNKLSCVGDIGTVDSPVYMPFITVNLPGVLGEVKKNMDVSIGGRPAAAAKNMNFPLTYTQAVIFITAKYSKVDFPQYPVTELNKLFEVNENRRRRLGG